MIEAATSTKNTASASSALPVLIATYCVDVYDKLIHGSRFNKEAAANFLVLHERVAKDLKSWGLANEFEFPDTNVDAGLFYIRCSERVATRIKDIACVNSVKLIPR